MHNKQNMEKSEVIKYLEALKKEVKQYCETKVRSRHYSALSQIEINNIDHTIELVENLTEAVKQKSIFLGHHTKKIK